MTSSGILRKENIKFVHPGAEFIPHRQVSDERASWNHDGQTGLRFWNNEESHKRKFMKSRGFFRKSLGDPDQAATLTFWGEWEPRSRFQCLDQLTSDEGSTPLPRFVHMPELHRGETGAHNTDPFVFGEEFWFTNCLQRRYSLLRGLDRGSIILFGTAYSNGAVFAVDTVFVVANRIPQSCYEQVQTRFPEQLRTATLDHNGLATNPANNELVFYSGALASYGPPFSFAPCRQAEDQQVSAHRRLELCAKKFGLPRVTQGCARISPFDPDLWFKVVEECGKQGLLLGHKFELPPIISASTSVPENPPKAGY